MIIVILGTELQAITLIILASAFNLALLSTAANKISLENNYTIASLFYT